MNPNHPKDTIGFIEPMAVAVATALEHDIDREVCAIYGLTPEEIKIEEEAKQR